MLRVVLDSNVYLSAILFGGVPEAILAEARRGAIGLAVSNPILDEVTRVLHRKFGWSRDQARQARREIASLATLVAPLERVTVITEDEPDNRVLECALAAAAQAIVTGDRRHLRPLQTFREMRILTPREFLGEIRPSAEGA